MTVHCPSNIRPETCASRRTHNSNLCKDQPTNFGALSDTERTSMFDLQERLISLPILTLARQEGRFTVDTVAYERQVGCVFLQDQPKGASKPIEYWPRGLNEAENGYYTTHKECLKLVCEILMIRPYLEPTTLPCSG